MINNELIKRMLIGACTAEEKNDFFLSLLNDIKIDEILSRKIEENKLSGREWPVPENSETMVGHKRLSNLEECINTVVLDGIEGDFIETGVWKGGACIYAKILLEDLGSDKKVFVVDSFEGLPKPDHHNYPRDNGDTHHQIQELSISLEEVKGNFLKYGVLNNGVEFIKGWFRDVLPTITEDQKFSILRLDGDMYESTMTALINLYPKLSKGGFIIIDDFCLPPCVDAVNDYRKNNGIQEEMYKIDYTGVFWRK
jgi:hypothetical protein